MTKGNDDGTTPLSFVAESAADLVVLEALVAKGAAVTRTTLLYTPLQYCFSTHDKRAAMCDRLLEFGCALEDKNKWGSTADRTARDSKGKTAMDNAVEYKNEKIQKLLAKP